ncbi:MAG: hypothetical protein J6S33_00930 [Aeriscardovia sp.]|nr:hypothetical protein [Aeriscardovia sp.]
MDRHFLGDFNINGEEIAGDLIYNKESGAILLNLIKKVKVTDVFPIGRSYGIDIITGVLHSGAIVTLFHNHWAKTYTQVSQNQPLVLTQQLVFVADYAICSEGDATNVKYNKLECVLENALNWSGLSAIELSTTDTSDFPTIKIKKIDNKNEYRWFGAKITFSTLLKYESFSLSHEEELKVVERLIVSIESDEKLDASNFISIRNKIISLISFAIKNNVNIDEQVLYDYDQIGPNTEYLKYHLYTSEQRLIIHESNPWDYNFNLCQLSPEKDIQEDKLEPIFNLYLSRFKYKDMPPEMVFLNIVQALETFHTRFFYDDSKDGKDKYVASVNERFGSLPNYSVIEKLLLNDTQKNCKHIILVSRLNDLLIRKYNKLFIKYYSSDVSSDASFTQTVVNTRNYYTHYDSSKEKKALKDDELLDAIRILSLLLEYSVCSQLGIDNQEKVRKELMSEELSSIPDWKAFQEYARKLLALK